MASLTLSEYDRRTRTAVASQLEWEPEVDATGITVDAHDGAVALAGSVGSYAGKLAAERAAKRVRGVRAVANELKVRLAVPRDDGEVALDAAQALALRPDIPPTIQVFVHDGHLVLTGTVPWLYHRTAAELAVRHIPGVVELTNRITVRPLASQQDVRRRITDALHRMADIDARRLNVVVRESTATLTGSVRSWPQRDAVERAAAAAPGIAHVENLIEVDPGDP